MAEYDKKSAKNRAERQGKQGYLFDANPSSYSLIMRYCSNSEIRKLFFESKYNFACSGEFNNKPIVLKILQLRDEKAKLLGYTNYAELSLQFKMAESPLQIQTLLEDISKRALPKYAEEIEERKEFFGLENMDFWDMGYFGRKLKEEKYALDEKELKKYFEIDTVVSGLFEIVYKLYGIDIKEVEGRVYDEGLKLYEVSKDGVFLSYFLTDYFYRELKRSGAWADSIRKKYKGNKPIVVNIANFQKGIDRKNLLTLGEVSTIFHEFGHALHQIVSNSPYYDLSGFKVEWDFIELPSQILENWGKHPDGMKLIAKHNETGEPISLEMINNIEKLDRFGVGDFTIVQNEYALLDILLHTINVPETIEELDSIVFDNYKKYKLLTPLKNYNFHTSFRHIFGGGYAGGYYSYMWAEIIEKEVWKQFIDTGDIFDSEVAKRFYDTILSQGARKPAAEFFRDFMGRDPKIDAFLEVKGLK